MEQCKAEAEPRRTNFGILSAWCTAEAELREMPQNNDLAGRIAVD